MGICCDIQNIDGEERPFVADREGAGSVRLWQNRASTPIFWSKFTIKKQLKNWHKTPLENALLVRSKMIHNFTQGKARFCHSLTYWCRKPIFGSYFDAHKWMDYSRKYFEGTLRMYFDGAKPLPPSVLLIFFASSSPISAPSSAKFWRTYRCTSSNLFWLS